MKIKSLLGCFYFVPRVLKIQKQLSQADGLVFMKFSGLRTLTGWDNHESMISFRNSGHHADAMKNVKSIGRAKSVTWESDHAPDWKEANDRLRDVQF